MKVIKMTREHTLELAYLLEQIKVINLETQVRLAPVIAKLKPLRALYKLEDNDSVDLDTGNIRRAVVVKAELAATKVIKHQTLNAQ